MSNVDPEWAKVIAEARRTLPEPKVVADAPIYMSGAWWRRDPWAGADSDFDVQLDSNMAEDWSGLAKIFGTEIVALKEIIERAEGVASDKATIEAMRDDELLKFINADANRVAKAHQLWERIVYPVRHVGGLIVRIFAPRDLMSSPIIQAMPVDEFIRGVSRYTAEQTVKTARLKTVMNRWRWATIILGSIQVLVLFSVIRRWAGF